MLDYNKLKISFTKKLNSFTKEKLDKWIKQDIIKNKLKKKSFKNWQEAVPFLGKKVIVDMVEQPDIEDYLTAIEFKMFGDRVRAIYLVVNERYYEYWQVKAKL